jgi:hypothetical protein
MSMLVPAFMRVLVFVRMPVSMRVFVRMGMLMLVRVSVFVAGALVAMLLVRRAAVDVELHALDVLPLRAVVVHVEVADVQLAQLPFERAGLHAEVNERADHHVAADAGDAVEVESFHGKWRGES